MNGRQFSARERARSSIDSAQKLRRAIEARGVVIARRAIDCGDLQGASFLFVGNSGTEIVEVAKGLG